MPGPISRRELLRGSALAAGAAAIPSRLRAQAAFPYADRSTVAVTSGNDRAQNIYNVLDLLHDQIQPVLLTKTSVLIKPNLVVSNNPLAATSADTLRGILQYLRSRAQFTGLVVIAESSAQYTTEAFANYGYDRITREYNSVTLVDLNEEARYVLQPVVDVNQHVQPIRAATRLFDPNTFIICSAMLKTHDRVVATMSVKNMAMGAPLHASSQENWWAWSDKPKMHDTYRLANVNILQMAQRLKPFWGVAVIDGYQGMEGEGPASGTAVDSRVAVASMDFVAADRVGIELMGIDPNLVGYLNYAWQLGLGQFDISKIDLRGPALSSLRRTYRLHHAIADELQWLQPFPACNAEISRPWRHF